MNSKKILHFSERYAGWVLIVLFCLFPIMLLLTVYKIPDDYRTWYDVFANLGRMAGIVGFVLYAINMVLNLRMRWLENLFGGLNKVYIAHHITGGIALAVLLFHPLFMAIRNIEIGVVSSLNDALASILLQPISTADSTAVVQENIAINAGIIAFWGLVVLLMITFFVRLPYQFWLFTHRFLGVAFLFAGIHVLLISSDVRGNPILFMYMALWLCIGLAAFVYKTLLGNIFIRRVSYKIVQTYALAGNIIAIEMKALTKPIQFTPGQFVFIRFLKSDKDGIPKEVHPFSIASAPTEPMLRLYVKALGDYTKSLNNLKKGAVVEVEGAFGRFSYTRFNTSQQVWIGGGIGITPFLSMARSIQPDAPKIDMFYCASSREELVDQEALSEYLPSHYPQFTYHVYIAKEQPGYISALYIQRLSGQLTNKEIFICGPPDMMKSLRTQLRELGVPNGKIHTEEFMFS